MQFGKITFLHEIIRLLLFLSLHTHLASSAAINPSDETAPIFQTYPTTNGTTFDALFHANNGSLEGPKDQFHCAGDRNWRASYRPSDCARALTLLQNTARRFGDEAFSWPSIAARGKLEYESVNTPIRYKWRKFCLCPLIPHIRNKSIRTPPSTSGINHISSNPEKT